MNTSDNALVYRLLNHAPPPVKVLFEELIEGKLHRQLLDDNLVFGYLENQESSIWNLLLHTGYLTAERQELDDYGRTFVYLTIPNKEIMMIYAQWVEQWFIISSQSERYYFSFLDALENGEVEQFHKHVASYIQETGSYFDFSQNTPERVFHVFMLGLLVGLRGKYEISSNREAGQGRYDIVFIPRNPQKKGIILEFKTCDDPKKLSHRAQEALNQIQQKQYLTTFKISHVTEVLLIGMAFCGKAVEVRSILKPRKSSWCLLRRHTALNLQAFFRFFCSP